MAAVANPQLNGVLPSDEQGHESIVKQLLQLRDQVFAGTHPRIKLPPEVIAHHAHLQTSPPQAHLPTTNGVHATPEPPNNRSKPNSITQGMHNMSEQANGGGSISTLATGPQVPNGNLGPGAKPPLSSDLDPIFLQKSEVTLKAERQLERQRVERSLKQQYDRRKQTASLDKDFFTSELPALFDPSETLQTTLQLVPHISALKAVPDRSSTGSDALHTNSYYSSQDSWFSQDSHRNARTNERNREVQGNNSLQEDAMRNARPLGMVGQSHLGERDFVPRFLLSFHSLYSSECYLPSVGLYTLLADHFRCQNNNSPYPHFARISYFLSSLHSAYSSSHPRAQEADELEEGEREESEEYEPPAPDELGAVASGNDLMDVDPKIPANSRPQYLNRISPPMPAASVVRNHIETPVAPQPERVSPLAVNKLPHVGDMQGTQQALLPSPRLGQAGPSHQNQNGNGRRNTPKGEGQISDSTHGKKRSPRNKGQANNKKSKNEKRNKRKRDTEADDQPMSRRASGKRVARSPDFSEPEIKDEPVSPDLRALEEIPPAHRIQDYADEDLEEVAARTSRPVYVREYVPSQGGYRFEYERAGSPGLVQGPSGVTYRRVNRDDRDLRRVASLQYARRPLSPQQEIVYTEPARRASSQAYIEQPRYRDDSPRIIGQTQYLEQVVSPAPIRFVDEEGFVVPQPSRRNRSPSALAPPPTPARYVVDQYGNKYYAAPPEPSFEPRRASVAPTSTRRIEPDLYERATTRAPVRIDGRFDDEPDVVRTSPRMAPPPPARRYVLDEDGREIEMERIPNRDVETVDSPRRYREQIPAQQAPRERERALSLRPREDDRLYAERPRDRTEMAPPSAVPRRQQSVVYEDLPLGYRTARPVSHAPRAYSVRPDAGYIPAQAPGPAMRASVQPTVRQQDREYIVQEAPAQQAPHEYRAVSVVRERGGIPSGEWTMMPPPSRYENARGEPEGGLQRVQSVRREYVDDAEMEEAYGGFQGRRVEYRY
ncbi:MAG: hypothetical protein M1820_009404 [Bogoriella megaspora]|nr:MAG: hypothetical protein M1820_009404 [Bogoriella megaspora]